MRKKLQESFKVDKNNIKRLPLTESESIIEKDGTTYKCRGAYEIPVWKLDQKNLNERVYPSKLAEKLMQESPVTTGLANHPENEADVRDTFAVEKNPHIKEGILYVDAYFVGDNGELAKEIIEAGGQIGLSSSAFGEVDDKGNVMVEGFELERYADWVQNPSYQVYAGKEQKLQTEKVENKEIPKEENINYEYVENEKLFEKNVTNNNIEEEEKVNNEKEEKSMADKENKKISIEEKNLKLGVKHLFNEAESTEDLKEKRQKYNEILDYCDGVEFASDYIEEAQNQINSIDEQLYELADKAKEVDSLKESTEKEKTELQGTLEEKESKIKELTEEKEQITEKYDKAVEMLDELKLREQKINEMYKVVLAEKNGMVKASEYNELNQYCEKIEEELKEKKNEASKLKRQIKRSKRTKNESIARPPKKEKEVVEEDVEVKDNTVEEEDDLEQYNDSPNFDAIREWYERKLEIEPRIKELKQELLTKRTLMEAQRAYMRLRDLIEDIPSPYKSSYYGSQIKEDEEKETKSSYTPLKIKEGWV